jgi:hypothetical protein
MIEFDYDNIITLIVFLIDINFLYLVLFLSQVMVRFILISNRFIVITFFLNFFMLLLF